MTTDELDRKLAEPTKENQFNLDQICKHQDEIARLTAERDNLAAQLKEARDALKPLITFVEEVAKEKVDYGHYGYGNPTQRAIRAKALLT